MLKIKFKIIKLILNTEEAPTAYISNILGPIGINPHLFYNEYMNYTFLKKKFKLPVDIVIFSDKSFKIQFNIVSTSFLFLTKFKELWRKRKNKKYLLKKFILLKHIKWFPLTKIKISKIIKSTLNAYYIF